MITYLHIFTVYKKIDLVFEVFSKKKKDQGPSVVKKIRSKINNTGRVSEHGVIKK